MRYPASIDKSEVLTLPLCKMSGRIHIITKRKEVHGALEALKKCPLVGFDTETRPSFVHGVSFSISLLQLTTDTDAYLFRLKYIGKNKELKEYLENQSYAKIGLSVHDDFKSLNNWMACSPQNFIDLQQYVKRFGIEEMGLRKIYAIVCHERISKREQLSNWDAPQLTMAQQLYAATDAWACQKIYYTLESNTYDNNIP